MSVSLINMLYHTCVVCTMSEVTTSCVKLSVFLLLSGKASLRVDSILGKGAFATVYQATDPMTSERMVLKVSWEIKTLDSSW